MKKLIYAIVLTGFIYTGCSKQPEVLPQKHYSVRIEVLSEGNTQITIPGLITEGFNGKYRKEFTASPQELNITVHSDKASEKSIHLYINNLEVAYRRGNCALNDYDLYYDMRNF
jgi:hypothetical protein